MAVDQGATRSWKPEAEPAQGRTSPPADASPARLLFADHLKVWLTILVVLHHVALVYAANSPFYYLEPANHDPLAALILVVFQLFNQAYFMGFFFLLSGYFAPGSYDRKHGASFIKDRLLRLGIPLLLWVFVLNPISSIGIYQMPSTLTGITTPLTWQRYPSLLAIGPLWFVAMLLVFDVCYAAWRAATRNRTPWPQSNAKQPGWLAVSAFILALALASYLIRVVLPLGKSLLNFPTLAYLPQYLSFFILGAVAYRRDWLHTFPSSMGKVGLAVALGATITLFPLALSGKEHFLGWGYWQSAVYALWDSIFSVGMCLALITFFRRFFNRRGRLGRFLARQAFTVYIIHIPIIVFLTIALRSLEWEHLLKFGLAAIIGVPLCFAAAFLVRRLPLASRVL